MLITNKFVVPDTCPEDCPGKKGYQGQGGPCCRCPVFNCTLTEIHDEKHNYHDTFRLVEPEDYREDWAEKWSNWFASGMIGSLDLYF